MLSLLGALLAWAIAGAQLGTSLHYTVISHEICGEHGELIHAGDHGEHRADHALEVTAVSEVAAEHPHEHCGVFGRPEDEAPFSAPTAVEVSAPSVSEVVWQPPRGAVVAAQRARLLSAPKTSPPT